MEVGDTTGDDIRVDEADDEDGDGEILLVAFGDIPGVPMIECVCARGSLISETSPEVALAVVRVASCEARL